jgi:hypothetical protein
MDAIEGSEKSANINQTLGIHPKVETVNTEHSKSLKSRNVSLVYSRQHQVYSELITQISCYSKKATDWLTRESGVIVLIV